MDSQPQNPEFRNNPENFHPCSKGLHIQLEKQTVHFQTVTPKCHFNSCLTRGNFFSSAASLCKQFGLGSGQTE